MENWSAHQLYNSAKPFLGNEKAQELVRYSNDLRDEGLPVIFSLNHLAKITGAPYKTLHDTINRKRESSNYRMYAIKKRSGGRRFIHAVASPLYEVQEFVNSCLLQACTPHSNSFAFHASGGIRECASVHCGARWLFQFDLMDFFYSVSEIDCYKVFRTLGYKHLLAFELGRLCTTTRLPKHCPTAKRVVAGSWVYSREAGDYVFARTIVARPGFPYSMRNRRLGVLPQGAPSSPMLANLAAHKLDCCLKAYADESGLIYSRYADDLTFSAIDLKHNRSRIRANVIKLIRQSGFYENVKKIRIAGPGSRKVVLGLLVDGEQPRLSKAMYKRIDRLLYGALQFGFQSSAAHFSFDSAYGFHNHLSGLVSFVKSVDQKRWKDFFERLKEAKERWG